jgi:hypothetical protein
MPENILEHWNDPEKRKDARQYIEKRLAEIREDKELFQKSETYSIDIELHGLPLVQLKFLEVIFKELLENEDEDLFIYLIHKGLEYEMMKLGIARQALMSNVADMMGIDLPDSESII